MQHEILKRTFLLDDDGRLAEPGYATKMNFVYNREKVKKTPFNLKEWNFYQFIQDHWVVQMTVGHVSYMCSATATLLDLDAGEKYEINSMRPFFIPRLDDDPERNSVSGYRADGFVMRFKVSDDIRFLDFHGKNKQYGDVRFHLEVENDVENEKMVIATPFEKPEQFYLNYKENYYQAKGFVKFDKLRVDLDGARGLMDWGRGIWPYRHEWYWGSLTARLGASDSSCAGAGSVGHDLFHASAGGAGRCTLDDSADFGFNIGWGFGNLDNATENMYFYKRRAYKVGTLEVKRDGGYMEPWHLKDGEGKMELHFRPVYDNYTQNKLLVVDTHCDQVYGMFDGFVMTDEGRVEFHDLLAFLEHAVNRW